MNTQWVLLFIANFQGHQYTSGYGNSTNETYHDMKVHHRKYVKLFTFPEH